MPLHLPPPLALSRLSAKTTLGIAVAAVLLMLTGCGSMEELSQKSKEALRLPPMTPELTYQTQCARCHEPALIGAKPSRLYNSVPLNAAHIEKIGRDDAAATTLVGGQLLGKSRWMPPFEDQLGPERVGELIDYLMTR